MLATEDAVKINLKPELCRVIIAFCVTATILNSAASANKRRRNTVAPKPNVIIILCDDLGYGDVGCYGAKDISTPHLDRMAAEGMRFTDFSMSAPLCTPSRASLLTGCYPGRFKLATGVLRPNATNGLASHEMTFAEIVKPLGYATGCIGKWHVGFKPGMRPMDQGFDSYYGVLHNLDHYETDHFKDEGGMPILRGDKVVDRPAVPAKMTGLYTTEALKFIEKHHEQPFLLYLAHAMPHLPYDASDAFKGTSKRGLYGDVVQELDWSTGQILDKIRALNLSQRTLVIFTSDNGPERKTPGTAAPLSGTKHTVFEGGVRVPMIAWWPETIRANRVCREFVAAMDLFPTIATLTGGTLPKHRHLDGYNISCVFVNDPGDARTSNHSPREAFYSIYGRGKKRKESIRLGHWKLHVGDRPQLFDLNNDLAERQNVAAQFPHLVKDLTTRFRDWDSSIDH